MKRDKYYVVFDFKDDNGKRQIRWVGTGLPSKSTKKVLNEKVDELVTQFYEDYCSGKATKPREKIKKNTKNAKILTCALSAKSLAFEINIKRRLMLKMSYDLEILVESRNKIKNQVIGNIRIEVNSQSGGRNRYYDTFSYITERRGSWCKLFETDISQRCFSAYNIATIKSVPKSEIEYPFWTDKRSGMYVLNIRPDYISSFKEVMYHLQLCSPKRRIMFLPRLQGDEYNNVCGVISLQKFFELLENDKILFNIVYIIQY